MISGSILARFNKIERFGDLSQEQLARGRELLLGDNREEAEKWLSQFPSEDELLIKLVEKLKGKSVYKNIKSLMNGAGPDKWTQLKTAFSLGTHIAIECEKGNPEFGVLLPDIYEAIGSAIFTHF
jgi:hypothetical protein